MAIEVTRGRLEAASYPRRIQDLCLLQGMNVMGVFAFGM